MSFVGGDTPGMRRLAMKMDQVANKLSEIQGAIGTELTAVPWSGPDADRYRQMWDTEYESALSDACRQLHGAATDMRADAQKQDQVSNDGGTW